MPGSLTRSRMTANRLQIDQALDALSDHEYKQLCRYARRLINAILPDGCNQAPEDFVQSAMQLTLSLNRKWNTTYPIRQHLFELIETEVMDYERKLRGKRRIDPILDSALSAFTDGDGNCYDNEFARAPSSMKNPEEAMHEQNRQEVYNFVVARLRNTLKKDPVALRVLELKLEGKSGPEIQKAFEWTQKEFATIDRHIRNKFDKIVEPFHTEARL